MERLTNGVDYCQLQCDFGKDRCFFQDQSKCYENNMYNKLREYEIAEEQGLLLRLPCKVGDTVYQIHSLPKSNRQVLVQVEADEFFIALCVLEKRFNKTVFLTKEEAELELENRQQSHAETIMDERNGR